MVAAQRRAKGANADSEEDENRSLVAAVRKQAVQVKAKRKAADKAKAEKAAGDRRTENVASKASLPAVVKAAANRERAFKEEQNTTPPEMQKVIDDALALGNQRATAMMKALGLNEQNQTVGYPVVSNTTRNPVPRTDVTGAGVPPWQEKKETAVPPGKEAARTTAPPGVVPTKAWIAECLETFNELRACHGTPQPLQWSNECFVKAKKMAKEMAATGNVTREPGAWICESYDCLVGQFALGGQAGRTAGSETWSAVHAIRLAFATAKALGFFKASYAGVALSECGRVICFDYAGPWLGGGPRGFINSNGPITGNNPGCDRSSKQAIAKLEAKLKASRTTFYDVGCAPSQMHMKDIWDILVSKKGHY